MRSAYVAKKDFATALTQLVIAGQRARSAVLVSNDPAIHVADKSAWTIGSSLVVTKHHRRAVFSYEAIIQERRDAAGRPIALSNEAYTLSCATCRYRVDFGLLHKFFTSRFRIC